MQKTSIIEIDLNELNLSTDTFSEGMACGTNHRKRQNKRTERYRKNNLRRLRSVHLILSA